ncbi:MULTISPECIES: hypothetical protein [Pseudoalteromonas]|uniref:Uncharacterized protein n=1 Tax=Pseudoalteromonas rubra TaxID=43658 RepID=A0A5S3V1M8_9GAMM|nr:MULTISPECIES: hypothetical protein [Pseudoalteromonas]MCG7561332.1 hypothetical protein [Pseudoalteromonas sp. McH1-42]MEC4087914.1 hypothetical protein [Pseudoalteromonas rubra]QPB86006.1 hypothetical protein CWC22_023705 [Pseudoalteromonas rubra]
MKKLILSVALALTSLGAQANTCSSIGCTSVIETLYTSENGNIYVGFPADEKLANCTPQSGVYFTLRPEAKNKNQMYSTLIYALAANKKVQARIHESSQGCSIAWVSVDTRW